MAQEYDVTLKSLVDRFPEAFAQLVLGEPIDKLEFLDKELPASKRAVDYLCEVTIDAESFILHIEFQSSYDANMPERMFQYAGRISEKYPRRTFYDAVLYLNEADRLQSFPNVYERIVRGKRKTYHEFDVIKIWEIDADAILNQKIKGLLPLVPLMRYDETQTEQIVSRCIEEVREIKDHKLQADAFAGLYVLSGLKKLKHIIRRLIMDERIEQWLEQSETYQEILAKGLKKGEEKGLQKGLQQGVTEGLIRSILSVLRARFGEFAEQELANQLRILEESRLNELVPLAVTAENLPAFERLVNGQA